MKYTVSLPFLKNALYTSQYFVALTFCFGRVRLCTLTQGKEVLAFGHRKSLPIGFCSSHPYKAVLTPCLTGSSSLQQSHALRVLLVSKSFYGWLVRLGETKTYKNTKNNLSIQGVICNNFLFYKTGGNFYCWQSAVI